MRRDILPTTARYDALSLQWMRQWGKGTDDTFSWNNFPLRFVHRNRCSRGKGVLCHQGRNYVDAANIEDFLISRAAVIANTFDVILLFLFGGCSVTLLRKPSGIISTRSSKHTSVLLGSRSRIFVKIDPLRRSKLSCHQGLSCHLHRKVMKYVFVYRLSLNLGRYR